MNLAVLLLTLWTEIYRYIEKKKVLFYSRIVPFRPMFVLESISPRWMSAVIKSGRSWVSQSKIRHGENREKPISMFPFLPAVASSSLCDFAAWSSSRAPPDRFYLCKSDKMSCTFNTFHWTEEERSTTQATDQCSSCPGCRGWEESAGKHWVWGRRGIEVLGSTMKSLQESCLFGEGCESNTERG